MKVVINKGFGGFELSDQQFEDFLTIKGIAFDKETSQFGWTDYFKAGTTESIEFDIWNIERNDPALVQVAERMEETTAEWHEGLKVVEIPDDIQWHIEEYDGNEWVAEDHRVWA